MFFAGCSVSERFVNPLFEVFDGGDLILSSYRDIEEPLTEVRVYCQDRSSTARATCLLREALSIVGSDACVKEGEIADEDWKLSYRRHFKTERIGERLVTVPEWELDSFVPEEGRVAVVLDPGLAFGTGKHETTRTCLEYIEELSRTFPGGASFLDMGCGSGILSIAAAKLGYSPVKGFDVDEEAVEASVSNARLNGVDIEFIRFALGRPGAQCPAESYDLVAANILGPLLIRFAPEIAPYARKYIVISGILSSLYDEVLAAFTALGFGEVSRKIAGEWTTGLLERRP